MRSFSVLLASFKEKLMLRVTEPGPEKLGRLEPGPPSSESDELHAVLSVHSVPQRDSTSSLAIGLQQSLDFGFIPMIAAWTAWTAWTARKAPSMAEMVLVASSTGEKRSASSLD